ncbi:hypothetical protein [Microcoleus sp. Pol7_B2]
MAADEQKPLVMNSRLFVAAAFYGGLSQSVMTSEAESRVRDSG